MQVCRLRDLAGLALVVPGLVFSPVLVAQQSAFVADFDPPVIDHNVPDSAATAGPQAISASITDDNDVAAVILNYRLIGDAEYKQATMRSLGGSEVYMVTLPDYEATDPGIEYYIEARDGSGNTALKGFPISPLTLQIEQAPAPTYAQQEGPASAPAPVAVSEEGSSSSGKKWIWIGLGAAVLGGLALSAGGGGGGGGSDNVDLTITANPPE